MTEREYNTGDKVYVRRQIFDDVTWYRGIVDSGLRDSFGVMEYNITYIDEHHKQTHAQRKAIDIEPRPRESIIDELLGI